MNEGAAPTSLAVFFAIAFGAAVVVVATVQALRARAAGLWWVILAGLGQAFLGLAATVHDQEGMGGRAASLQILVMAAAAVLVVVCSRPAEEVEGPGDVLPRIGRVVAWAAVLGLPVTVGFHSKVVLLRTLLDLDWTGLTVLALAAGTAAMWPALAAFRSPMAVRLNWPRRAAAAGLILALVVPGIYPQWAISAADWLTRLAFS